MLTELLGAALPKMHAAPGGVLVAYAAADESAYLLLSLKVFGFRV